MMRDIIYFSLSFNQLPFIDSSLLFKNIVRERGDDGEKRKGREKAI